MNSFTHWTLALALCGCALSTAGASDAVPQPDDSAQVAGKLLRLNGAGLGVRYVFKVYSIGLYLLEPKSRVEEIVNSDAPRRISIQLLRDVSSRDFAEAIEESAAAHGGGDAATGPNQENLVRVGMAIAAQPRGLRKGDRLTFDWVPGVGTVIELNQVPLLRPNADKGLYSALLNVWLGVKAADPGLKARLLGAADS